MSGLRNGDFESDKMESDARAGPSKNGTEVNVVIAKVRMTALRGRIDSGEESSLYDSFMPAAVSLVEWLMSIVDLAGGAIP